MHILHNLPSQIQSCFKCSPAHHKIRCIVHLSLVSNCPCPLRNKHGVFESLGCCRVNRVLPQLRAHQLPWTSCPPPPWIELVAPRLPMAGSHKLPTTTRLRHRRCHRPSYAAFPLPSGTRRRRRSAPVSSHALGQEQEPVWEHAIFWVFGWLAGQSV